MPTTPYRYADLAHIPRERHMSWPLNDPNPPPEGCDTRTAIMLSAMAEASFDALGFEREAPVPVDVAMRKLRARESD